MDMIESVARSLCRLHGSDPDRIVPGEIGHGTNGTYEGVAGAVMAVKRIVGTKVTEPHPLWLHFVRDAEAAMKAMLEPTWAMREAIRQKYLRLWMNGPGYTPTIQELDELYTAAIEAAISESKP